MPKWTDKPWERQKGESEKAFEAFAVYRDMGEKSILKNGRKRRSSKWQAEHSTSW